MTIRQTAAQFTAKMDARLTNEELESFGRDKIPMAELMCTLDQQVSRLRMTVANGGRDEHIADHLADVAITCLQAFCNVEPDARGVPTPILDGQPTRREVALFALDMERKLRENDDKSGWAHLTWSELVGAIHRETAELARAITHAEIGGANVVREAADVANYAMMVADNARRQL